MFTLAIAFVLAAASDPLAQTIERLHHDAGSSVQKDAQTRLDAASKALAGGRRLLAIYQTATILPVIEGAKFASAFPVGERNSETSFEKAWKRDSALKAGKTLPPIAPALLRGFAEGSMLRRRNYYDASLDYARSTTAESGFAYLGLAHGEQSLVAFLRTLAAASNAPAPRLRSLEADIDALQHILLAAYKPPASLDRHDEFITASAVLKEARELDQAGLHYGALFRYLDAAQRTGRITGTPSAAPELREHLAQWRKRLATTPGDPSIAELFLEMADADLESGKPPATASSVDSSVLPRYFAALGPAPEARPKPKAAAHVTLVRWPYT